jgi:phosphatidylserine/phosphatidylglycerophosphate/cardiolipin synthase-like enzyme
MKKLLLALVFASALPLKAAELQLVESVPDETVYGSTLAARPAAVWLELIGSAKKTLELEQFYIADQAGEVLEPVLAAVKDAAKRGVKTRFLVDKVMLKESEKSLPALKEAGVDVRVIDFKKAGGGVQHSKFFIVDGAEAFVGSQNFDWRSLKHIHELGLRLKSVKAAADLANIFEADWAFAGGAETKKMFAKAKKPALTSAKPEKALLNGGEVTYSLAYSPVNFVPKGADTEIKELLNLLDKAKHTVRGQVMTYSLEEHGSKRWADLDSAFRKAAARGVKVELVFADWGMGGKADRDIKALASTENIQVKISSLPQHSSAFIPFARVEHLKYLVIDGETAYVTTSNWGPGYYLTSRGVAVFIKGPAGAAVLEDIFGKTWAGPYALPVDPIKEYRPVKRN